MSEILYFLQQNSILIELDICIILFLLPLKKREHFRLRLSFYLLLLLIGGSLTFELAVNVWHIHKAAAFFVSFLLMVYTFYRTAELTLPDAIFAATCSFAVQHMSYNLWYILDIIYPMGAMTADVSGKAILLMVAVSCYLLFARKMAFRGGYNVKWSEAIGTFAVVLSFAFFLSMIADEFYIRGGYTAKALYIICRAYAFLCCAFVLWVQTTIKEKVRTEIELGTQKLLFGKQREQYELSRENIDLINRKCHDLKHQIAAIRSLPSESQRDRVIREIEESVMIYDSVAKTGNDVLDTILTERSLYCEREGIVWTCMADGKSLGFVDSIDLYTMLGNALDNAIEAVNHLTDPEQRVISLNIVNRGRMVVIRMENYYRHEIQMQEGMPITSKEDTDYHGIGLHSIQYTAQKYNGSVSVKAENRIFQLCILLPIPE